MGIEGLTIKIAVEARGENALGCRRIVRLRCVWRGALLRDMLSILCRVVVDLAASSFSARTGFLFALLKDDTGNALELGTNA